MPDLTFYLASTPPLLVPRLDVHVLQTDTEAGSTHSYTGLSRPPETRIPFGQDINLYINKWAALSVAGITNSLTVN